MLVNSQSINLCSNNQIFVELLLLFNVDHLFNYQATEHTRTEHMKRT